MSKTKEKQVFISPEVEEKWEKAREALKHSEFGKRLREKWLES